MRKICKKKSVFSIHSFIYDACKYVYRCLTPTLYVISFETAGEQQTRNWKKQKTKYFYAVHLLHNIITKYTKITLYLSTCNTIINKFFVVGFSVFCFFFVVRIVYVAGFLLNANIINTQSLYLFPWQLINKRTPRNRTGEEEKNDGFCLILITLLIPWR